MSYKIYKASIDTYRVMESSTGVLVANDVKNLVLTNVTARVDLMKYFDAQSKGFRNSGDPLDFFAWLECDSFEIKSEPNVFHRIPGVMFYNPFKSAYFRDRNTGKNLHRGQVFPFVLIEGNSLRYIPETANQIEKRVQQIFSAV